jgi:hypothetical protein
MVQHSGLTLLLVQKVSLPEQEVLLQVAVVIDAVLVRLLVKPHERLLANRRSLARTVSNV